MTISQDNDDTEYLDILPETPENNAPIEKKDNIIYEGVVYYICFNNRASIGTHILELDERIKLNKKTSHEIYISGTYVDFMDELIISGIRGLLNNCNIQFRLLFKIQFKYKERTQMEELLTSRKHFFIEQIKTKNNLVINHRKIISNDERKERNKLKELTRYRLDDEYRERKRTNALRSYYVRKNKIEQNNGSIPSNEDINKTNIKNVYLNLPVRRRGRPKKIDVTKDTNQESGLQNYIIIGSGRM